MNTRLDFSGDGHPTLPLTDSLPPRNIGSIHARAMLETLVEHGQTLTDEEGVEVFVGTLQMILDQCIATGADEAGSLLLQGFCDVIGVTLRRWAVVEAVSQAAQVSVSPVACEEGVACLSQNLKDDLGELVRKASAAGGDAAVVDALLQSAAAEMVGFMVTGMVGAAEIGMDVGRAEEQAMPTGRLQ
jgi:hypothetical protein